MNADALKVAEPLMLSREHLPQQDPEGDSGVFMLRQLAATKLNAVHNPLWENRDSVPPGLNCRDQMFKDVSLWS